MSAQAEAGQSGQVDEDVVVVSEVVMSSPPTTTKPAQGTTPKNKMKQMRLPFAPIQKESAINIQRQKQLKEQELKAKLEEEKKLEDAQKAKLEEQKKLEEAQKSKELEKEAAKKDPAAANSNSNSKPSKAAFCKYQLGDLVWAKMKSFPAWPGKIVMGPDHIKLPAVTKQSDETSQCVRFFGSHDHAFVAEDAIWRYDDPEAKEKFVSSVKGKPAKLAKAVEEIEAVIAAKTGTGQVEKQPEQKVVEVSNVAKSEDDSSKKTDQGVTKAVTKKRKLSESSNDSDAGNRRKSARGNGQDKASSNTGTDRVVVKDANVPEVEIIETLKVKIKPKTPRRAAKREQEKAEDSDIKLSLCATPPPVKKSASDPTNSGAGGKKGTILEKLQNLNGVSVTRGESDTPKTPSGVQRLNSSELPKTPVQKLSSSEVATPKTPTMQRLASSGSVGSPQPCSPATMEHRRRSVSVQVAKLKVKAMEDKDKMEKAVKDQEFLLAADLKNSLASTQQEMQRLEKVLERSDPEEMKSEIAAVTPARKRPTLSETISTCQTPTTPSVIKTSAATTPSSAKIKKLTPKQQKEREDKAKAREEEKKVREEKKLALEKEKEEKKLEREREKKERDAAKEKEKAEKEAQKEKEKAEKEAQKEKERVEKEKERMEKEAQKLKEKAEKEAQREAQKKEKELEKERARKEKQEEKDKQDKLEKAKQEKLAQSFKSFFKAKADGGGGQGPEEGSESALADSEKKGEKGCVTTNNSLFNQFRVKTDMRLAPLVRAHPLTDDRRSVLDTTLSASGTVKSLEHLYIALLRAGSHKVSSSGRTWKLERGSEDDGVQILDDDDDEGGIQTVPGCSVEIDIADMMEDDNDKKKRTCQSRAKLLQFEENERPAYWGTWSKTSARVGPRRPFARDCDHFDYDYDSDEDWEDEQDGEDLGDDDEKDADEDKGLDDIEDDNEDGFFVGHGVLDKDEARHEDDSDDEGDFNEDEEMKQMKMKAAQFEEDYINRKKKLPAKLKPRVYGLLWNATENQKETSEEDRQKSEIVTRQLMALLSPFRAIIHNNNGGPIATSYTQSKESSPAGKDDSSGGGGGTQQTPKTPTSNKSSAEKKAAAADNANAATPTSAKSNRSGKSKTPGTPTSSKAKKIKAKKVVDAIADIAATPTTPTAPKVNPLGAWLALKSPKAPHAPTPSVSETDTTVTPIDKAVETTVEVIDIDTDKPVKAQSNSQTPDETPSGEPEVSTSKPANETVPESKSEPSKAATPMDISDDADKVGQKTS